jgi:hypothetical protein
LAPNTQSRTPAFSVSVSRIEGEGAKVADTQELRGTLKYFTARSRRAAGNIILESEEEKEEEQDEDEDERGVEQQLLTLGISQPTETNFGTPYLTDLVPMISPEEVAPAPTQLDNVIADVTFIQQEALALEMYLKEAAESSQYEGSILPTHSLSANILASTQKISQNISGARLGMHVGKDTELEQ